MNIFLLRAIRIVISADSDPARQVLFANLVQARADVRLAFRVHGWLAGSWASALLVSGYGLAYFVRISAPEARPLKLLTVAKHANARRQIERVAGWVGREHCGSIQTMSSVGAVMANLRDLFAPGSRARLRSVVRIVHALERTHGFLVACRAAAAIAWYFRSRSIISTSSPGAVLVSSDSNPEEVGFIAAAHAFGIPRVFVSHAYPTPFSPPLDFSLAILEGKAAVRARLKKGPIRGQIVLAGVEGESLPLDLSRLDRPNPVVGIFAPKALSWTTLAAIVSDCRQTFGARRIVIRWHPSRLDPARQLHRLGDLSGIEESPMTAALPDVAQHCDWVVADENSNVHLPVLKLGIPTVAVKRLGLYPESRSDMYGFAAAGIVFPPVQSLREVHAERVKAFFGEGWVERFRDYDASYLRPQADVAAEVRQVVWSLFEPAPVNAPCA